MQDEAKICVDICVLHNSYTSHDRASVHVRWCDTCEHWIHEHCAGQAVQRNDITPSANQSYLKSDFMDLQRGDDIPSEVLVLLGWPICRQSKEFVVDGKTYWHPFSMELVVQMARMWHRAGISPTDWKTQVMDLHEDCKFMWNELQALLEASCPSFYLCPDCSSYI
jgi:hypothetical protein